MTHCRADMYADDTTFFTSGHNVKELNIRLNKEMENVSHWCNVNKMVINTKKTKSLLITTRFKHNQIIENGECLTVLLDNEQLKQVHYEKLLGVWIDDKLTWDTHIKEICKVISSRLALLRRIRPFLDIASCKLYYNAYVLPSIDYCSLIWSSCAKHNLDRIEKTSKICSSNYIAM